MGHWNAFNGSKPGNLADTWAEHSG
jgi:hypothetical protein